MAIFLFGLSQQDLQLRFLEYGGLGGPWRLVSLSAYGDPENPEYAAIWHHDPGHPTQALALRVKAGELGVIEEMWNTYGMLPTVVTAVYGPAAPGSDYDIEGSNVRWNFVFEKSPQLYSDMQFFHWVPYDTLYQAQRARLPGVPFQGSIFGGESTAPDRDIVSFDVIRTESGTTVYTGLLYPKTTPPVGTGLNTVNVTNPPGSATWENHSDTRALRSGWARPELAVPHPVGVDGERTVVTQWRDDVLGSWPSNMADGSFTGGAVVVGPFGLWNIQGAHDDMTAKGYLPYRIAVSGSWSEARVCIVYARSTVPLERKFVVVDARDSSPPLRIGGQVKSAARHRLFDLLASRQQGDWHTRAEARGMSRVEHSGPPARGGTDRRIAARQGFHGRLPRPEALSTGQRHSPDLFDDVYPAGGTASSDAFGGSGSASAESAQGQGVGFNRYHILDEWVREHMERTGARAAQLAIARGGRLVVSRAYTSAEHNYPVTQPSHLFGVASVSKGLTGMAAASEFFGNGEIAGLLQGLGEVFQIPSAVNLEVQARLQDTPLYLLMQHRAGWPVDVDNSLIAWTARGVPPPPLPGDMLLFVQQTPDNFILPGSPGSHPFKYGGVGVRALSEAISRKKGAPFGNNYEAAMRDWWQLDESKARARLPTPAQCALANIVPMHSLVIGLSSVATQNGPTLRVPLAYGGYPAFALAAGGWCMSAATVVRILSGMDPSCALVPSLVPSPAVQLMLNGLGGPNTHDYGPGLFQPISFSPPVLYHSGSADGVYSAAGITFRGYSAYPSPAAPTFCFAYHQNRDVGDPTPSVLPATFDALSKVVEDAYGWESDDLFAMD
ncbi:MAG: serine hydrolase [Myxococcales bacterium]|nr:serine hydrolase [Myxococcales bacterium]